MVSLLCGSVWGRAQKGDNATAWPLEFWLGGSCTPALALMLDSSFSSPYATGALSACCWSPEGMSLRKSSVCCRPFNWRLLRIPQFLPLPQSLTGVFIARSYRDLSSWYWNHGLGGLVWAWDPLLPRYPSQFLSTTRGYGTAYSCLQVFAHPTCLAECDFFNSLVVGLPYSLIFWRFWVIVVL